MVSAPKKSAYSMLKVRCLNGLFVGAGAAAGDVILGLIIGNALAVLTWALVTAPIAVATRLSLYAYLRKIAGPDFLKLYSVINGVMFLGLAGAMITVSASAVRVLYNATFDGGIATQTGLWPTDLRFVLVALLVGAVVMALAVMGFKRLAQFAAAVARGRCAGSRHRATAAGRGSLSGQRQADRRGRGHSGVWLGARVLAFAALGWMVIQAARVALAGAAAYPAALEAFRAGLVWPALNLLRRLGQRGRWSAIPVASCGVSTGCPRQFRGG